MKHLTSLKELSKDEILELLDLADNFIDSEGFIRRDPLFPDKKVVNIFCEPSTRTKISFEDSAQRVISNLENICEEAGASLNDIVKLNIYLLDLENFDTLNKIMEERFSEPFPARATVEVARLPKDVMIEMDAIVSLKK